jgi:excisionase family DNA binding protein
MSLKRKLLGSTVIPQNPAAHVDHASEPTLPLVLRIERVEHELQVSRRTVYELVKAGKLHLVRVGARNSRIRTEEVLKLVGATSKPLYVPRLRNQNPEIENIAAPTAD